MKIKQIVILIIALSLSSCASLTKTQIDSVNQFAQSSKNFSDYPSKIIYELAVIRVKRGIYFANSLDNPKIHIGELDSLYNNQKSDFELSKKIDVTFKIIDKYAQSLLLLSSDKHVVDLEFQAKNFGGDLDSLITIYNSLDENSHLPVGLGGAVNQLIVFGGKQYIRSKQATKIKKFLPEADRLIEVMTTNLLAYLQSTTIQELIENEEEGINSNYLSFLRQRKPTIENERDYLVLKNNLDAIKNLQKQTISATNNLRLAHKKLVIEIQRKKKLKEVIKELQVLSGEIKELKKTMNAIKTFKE